MQTNDPVPETEDIELTQEEEIQDKIVTQVREDSENLAKLTPAGAISPFFGELTLEEANAILTAMLANEQYQDIKAMRTPDDSLYFYSEQHFSLPEAQREGLIEGAKAKIADNVRHDSGELAKVTAVGALVAHLPDPETDDVEPVIAKLQEDSRYQDIQSVAAPSGAAYLFSEQHMTKNYAIVLTQVEEDDPAATIAHVVRDESRIYPRPTHIYMFLEHPFNMDRDKIGTYVAHLLEQEEYNDIKRIQASTGAIYLHSDELASGLAKSLIEWEEVGQHENP